MGINNVGDAEVGRIAALKERMEGRWLPFFAWMCGPLLHDALRRVGRHTRCPRHGGTDGFRFFPDAASTGGAVCNTCGFFRDGFALLKWVEDCTFLETVTAVEEWLLEQGEDVSGDGYRPKSIELKTEGGFPDALNEKAVAYLNRVRDHAEPGHRLLRDYYRSRGLTVEPSDHVGFLDGERYDDGDGETLILPAMVAPFQSPSGDWVSVLRTYLDPSGEGKARVAVPKKYSAAIFPGATNGAAIRLREPGNILGLAEGIETAESVFQATGMAVWPTGSAGGLAKFVVPNELRSRLAEVVIWSDSDENEVGQNAARRLAGRLRHEGLKVLVVFPNEIGTDWNDVLCRNGEEAIRAAFENAIAHAVRVQTGPKRIR